MKHLLSVLSFAILSLNTYAADDVVVADFEATDYSAWVSTGKAFGESPAHVALPGQMSVGGYVGKGFVNSFHGGDDSIGTLTSPQFKIQRKFITFLIGGGGYTDETCMNLLVDGKIVRTATGKNTESGGSEQLEPSAWDVSDFRDRQATIAIIDSRKGGWGHINVDHIIQMDELGSVAIAASPIPQQKEVVRKIAVKNKLLHFPVKGGAKKRVITVSLDGKQVRRFDIELADGDPDWWAPLDVSAWIGSELTVVANILPMDSKAMDSIQQTDSLLHADDLYKESLRSQFHFSPKRGWMNDPNGLVYYNGEYHLFYQHNPYGWSWGNMHWGHATSRDMVHWVEHGEVLYPDELGAMFSGSAVVDWDNTSGFGMNDKPPLVLIYTAAGNPTTQCIAYSNDGRKFTKYEGNPVIKQITGGNRDPKVFWHLPTKKWILVLYVESTGKKHTIHFFSSPNLKDWELQSVAEGGSDNDKFYFECPDFFELPVDGDPSTRKWVLNAANSQYSIGTFDGKSFQAEESKIADVRGKGFYAAQTFSDIPDGRRIQIGWQQAPSPRMSFNQLQSIPMELTLKTTSDGIRLIRTPARELIALRAGPNQADSLKDFRSELIELRTEFEPGDAKSIEFELRGAKIVYDVAKLTLTLNGVSAPAPLVDGNQSLIIYMDQTVLEVFASGGQTYAPLPFIPKNENQMVTIREVGGKTKMKSLEVYRLKSAWERVKK